MSEHHRPPHILFFGMQSYFSSPVLIALLTSGIEVTAIVVPASSLAPTDQPPIQPYQLPRTKRAELPLFQPAPSILSIATTRQIPIWEVSRLAHPDTIATLTTYQPDLICVACFSHIIPRAVRALPRLGCLNVHPSLLPVNRGPVPLFWTLYDGECTTGVTIHFIEEYLDSGDILAQETIVVPDGIGYNQLEIQCARRGGLLLADVVWALFTERSIRVPQDEARSTYHSFPSEKEYVIDAYTWRARRLYNFIRGIHDWHYPITIRTENERILVQDALVYSEQEPPPPLNSPHERIIRCQDGWVHSLL